MRSPNNDERALAVALHSIRPTREKGGIELRKYVIATAVVACSGLVGIAQSPSPTTPAQQAPPQAAAAPASITLTGCVYKEKDVPGRAPNVAEKAGVMEDYILADVRPASASGAVGTSGTAAAPSHGMYKLELIADEKLKAAVGKRVEVTGKIDAEAGDSKSAAAPAATSPTDKAIGRDKIDLPEFEVASMREVPGDCPAAPAGK